MSSVKLRKEVHNYIDQVDETVLKMVHAMLKEYSSTQELTEEQELLVEERRAEYKSGKSKALPLSEFRKLVEKKIRKK